MVSVFKAHFVPLPGDLQYFFHIKRLHLRGFSLKKGAFWVALNIYECDETLLGL